jgi:DNA polymerase-3 subunit alpha
VFEQAKAETVRVANLCKGVKLDRGVKLPRFEDADKKLLLCLNNEIKSRNLHIQPGYFARLKEEYNLIKNKGFSSYFLIMKEIIDKAREIAPQIMGWDVADEAVGPARGSAGGSLACYLLGITDIDPMKHNLLFSRFLNENRGGRSMKTRFLQPEI